jgi:hypothetical protein
VYMCVWEREGWSSSLWCVAAFNISGVELELVFIKRERKGRGARVSLDALKSLRIKSITATRVVEVLAQRVASSVKVWILKYCPLLLWIYECGLIMEYACR